MATIRRCGLCRQEGHNRSKCTTPGFGELSAYYAARAKRGTESRKCGFCNEVGHTVVKCETKGKMREWFAKNELGFRPRLVQAAKDAGFTVGCIVGRVLDTADGKTIVMRAVTDIMINCESGYLSVQAFKTGNESFSSGTKFDFKSRVMNPKIDHWTNSEYAAHRLDIDDLKFTLNDEQVDMIMEGIIPDNLPRYSWFVVHPSHSLDLDLPEHFLKEIKPDEYPGGQYCNLRVKPRKARKDSSEQIDDEDEDE